MSATLYDAYRIGENNSREKLGRISIKGSRLSIMSLEKQADRTSVQGALDEFNNRPFLVEKAPPVGENKMSATALARMGTSAARPDSTRCSSASSSRIAVFALNP